MEHTYDRLEDPGRLPPSAERNAEMLHAYIESRYAWMDEDARKSLHTKASWAAEQYTLHIPTESRLTLDPLPPRNVRGPVDPENDSLININVPLTGDDLKAYLWGVAQLNNTDRAAAIKWAKECYERSIQPRKHYIALVEKQLQNAQRAKELMPDFDDMGAQKYLEAALQWWQEGNDAVE